MNYIGIEEGKKVQIDRLLNKISLSDCNNYIMEFSKGDGLKICKNDNKILLNLKRKLDY